MPGERSEYSANENIETLDFETILAEVSAAFVRATANQISSLIDYWLQRIVLSLGIDRATVGQLNPADGLMYATHQWARAGVVPIPQALNALEAVPWLTNKLLADEPLVFSRLEDVPAEAAIDLEFAKVIGTKSFVAIPLRIGGSVVGGVTFDAVNCAQTWLPQTVQRLHLIAEVFGNALERERAVAEIRRLREEISQTSRIATMGELTASLAHELNQPLGAVLSNAQAARRFLAAKKPDLTEVQAAIEEIIHDNSRAVETLRNVRALFQNQQVEMSPLDPCQLLLEAEHMLSVGAIGRDISIELDLPPALPAIVGNRPQLLEVLMNLGTNAFDSICDNGDGPRVVNLRACQSKHGYVQFAVRDSGEGIEQTAMPRLFEAFFTTKSGGLGIGLRLTRSIIENHGGRVWAERNPDRGATLIFELPVKEHAENRN